MQSSPARSSPDSPASSKDASAELEGEPFRGVVVVERQAAVLADEAGLERRVEVAPFAFESFEWRRVGGTGHGATIAAAHAPTGALSPYRAMEIHFLGGATTVTGSQFLLVTERARVLIDCGMFQGSPNESIRNRVPFGFEPDELDAVLLTHAHLDHCGLIPMLVKAGYGGPIHATAGTVELADARPAGLREAARGIRQAQCALGAAKP